MATLIQDVHGQNIERLLTMGLMSVSRRNGGKQIEISISALCGSIHLTAVGKLILLGVKDVGNDFIAESACEQIGRYHQATDGSR